MTRFMQIIWLGVGLIIAAISIQSQVCAADGPDDRTASEAAIHQTAKQYLAAVEKGDAKAMAAFWTADGTYTDELGETFKSRELIEMSFAAKQTTRPSIQISKADLRFLTPDVAIQEGNCTVGTAKASSISGCFTAIWVRKDKTWKLASLRESRVEALPAAADHLAALAPFVGEWSGQTGDIMLRVSSKWNAGKTYLRREFAATSEGKEIFHGIQYVGWDPVSNSIRSWTFNDDGGYADGHWSLEGNVWMVASSGVKPNGETSPTTQIFKFIGNDRMIWKLKSIASEEATKTVFEAELKRDAK